MQELFDAVKSGDLIKVRDLIENKNADQNIKDKDGLGLVHWAAKGQLSVLKYLIEQRKMDPTVRSNEGRTPLHLAAGNNHLREAKYLLEELRLDLYVKNDAGRVPLHSAAFNGHLPMVIYLTKDRGLDPNVQDNDGDTPLHWAAGNNHLPVVKYLLTETKTVPILQDNGGFVPLHWAAFNGHFAVVKYLVEEKKLNPLIKNNIGKTALDLAKEKNREAVVAFLSQPQYFNVVNTPNAYSYTASLPTPKPELSTVDYKEAMQQAAEATRQPFLGQLENDYRIMLEKYQQMGLQQFQMQCQEQQNRSSQYLQKLGQQLEQQSQDHQQIFQDNLQLVLAGKPLDALSDEMILQLRSQLDVSMSTSMQGLLDSKQYQDQIQYLQEGILQRIQDRQEQMASEMIQVQEQQKQIQDQNDPIYQGYLQKQQMLAEQQELFKNEPIKVFYNTIEKVLGSRLMGAMSLASGMIKRVDTKKEKAADIGVNVASKLLNCIPGAGGIAQAVGSSALAIGVVGLHYYIDKKQEQKYQNTLDSVVRLEDAMILAELVARRLAQSYQKYIIQNKLSLEEARVSGENAANIVYSSIKAGELTNVKTLDEKIKYLIQKVQAEAAKQKAGFFKKNAAIFKEPVIAQFSSADKKHLYNVAQSVEDVKAKAELESRKAQMDIDRLKARLNDLENYSIFKSVATQVPPPIDGRFSLHEESAWPTAIAQMKTKLPNNFSFEIKRAGMMLTVQSNSDTQSLKNLGVIIKDLFEKEIQDWVVDNGELVITAKATQNAIDLENFLQKAKQRANTSTSAVGRGPFQSPLPPPQKMLHQFGTKD